MSIEQVITENAPPAVGPYSQGIIAGNLVFTAGEIPLDPKIGTIPETIEEQAELAMNNLLAVINAAGSDRSHVVSVNLYLADMGDFAKVNAIYEKFFAKPFPARTCIAAASLPKGVKIEVSAIAAKTQRSEIA